MKFCAIVVLYNPNKNVLKNIQSYIEEVEKLYIVDNSQNNNFSLLLSDSLDKNKKIKYIPLMENTGIAHALNIGCKKARADGFDWCMTMDQDSVWNSNQLKNYINSIEENISEKNVSFAPNLKLNKNYRSTTVSFLRKITKDKIIKYYNSEQFPNSVITSGNVINLQVWKEIEGFYEPFFIDEVDNEFCFRLKEYGNGGGKYNIIMFNDIFLEHELGEAKKTFLPKETHSPARIYYMTRNILYMKKMHPKLCKEEQYSKKYLLLLIKCLFTFDLKKIKMFIKGKNDFKKNKLGKLNIGE